MNRKLKYAILGADLFWIAGVFVLAQFLCNEPTADAASMSRFVHLPAILATILIWVVLYFTKKLDCFCRGWHLPSVFAQVTVGVCYLMGSLVALALCAKYSYSPLSLLSIACLLPLGFVSIRGLALQLVTSQPASSKRRVVILGAGRVARELAQKIAVHPEMPMEVVGLLFPSDADPAGRAATSAASSISLRSLNIVKLLEENNVQELIITEPAPPGLETAKLISRCRETGMRIHLVPQHYELYLSKAELTEVEDVPLLSLQKYKLPALGMAAKRCMDVVGALLLLALTAPLLALSAAALYAKKDKAFRKELRCGKNGTPFWMHRLNIDRDAKRLEGFARILVQFSLTELPQLWNVLKGDMSLVGPRPESRDRVRHYSEWQRQRLAIQPGLTGLAQVRGLREQHSSEEKARFDLQYIGQWSLFMDLSLLLQTGWALFLRLMKEESLRRVPAPQCLLTREFGARRMMHADRAQSGAD